MVAVTVPVFNPDINCAAETVTVNTSGFDEAVLPADETITQEGVESKLTLSGVPSFVVICTL